MSKSTNHCPDCRGQQISCNCKGPQTNPRQPWDGEWPDSKECRDLGFWCYWGPGWIQCDADHPEAVEDLNRLAVHHMELREIMEKNAREHAAYIKAGVCSQCGACNAEEAEKKCTATRDITDEYSCAGDELWPDANQ